MALTLRKSSQGLLILVVSSLGFLSNSFASTDGNSSPISTIDEDHFRFAATVSFWAPANQTTGYMNKTNLGSLNDSISDNIQSSNGSAMATLEGHYGSYGLLADLVYWDNNNGKVNHAFAYKKSTVYTSAHSDTSQSILTGGATYTLFHNPDWFIDGLLGARYINNDNSVNLDGAYPATIVKEFSTGLTQSGIISSHSTATSAIIGIKGRARIADSDWFVPFYGDLGSGGTTFSNTWQTQLGIARSFDWFEVNLSFRALYFELADGALHTKNMFFGPSLGATFNF